MNLDRIQKLDELLRVTQLKYDNACLMADESKQQHAELLDYMNNTSIVRSEFNQGRIDLNLAHLNEKLQIENASLKMAKSTLTKDKANFEMIVKVLRENDAVR
jgi:folylpolyglutamate synthase/dihydropteroate synthase